MLLDIISNSTPIYRDKYSILPKEIMEVLYNIFLRKSLCFCWNHGGGGFWFQSIRFSSSTSTGGIWWISWARLAHVVNPIGYKQLCLLYYRTLFRQFPLSIQQSPPLYNTIAWCYCIRGLYSMLYGIIRIRLGPIAWRL